MWARILYGRDEQRGANVDGFLHCATNEGWEVCNKDGDTMY